MADAVAILLAQFNALRTEIAARSKAQGDAVQLAVTAVGALGGLSFSAGDARLLLLIPLVAAILGLFWLDHAANIFNLGDFIKDRLMPRLKVLGEMDDMPDYEVFVREYERNVLGRLRAFGLPPFLVFVVSPLVAMVVAFDSNPRDWVFWSLSSVDLVLVAIFIFYWLPFLSGPRTRRPAPVDGV